MTLYSLNVLGHAADLRISRYRAEIELMDGDHVQVCHVLASTIYLHSASLLSFTHNPAHLIHPCCPER